MSQTLINYPSDTNRIVKLAAPANQLNGSAAALNASLKALCDALGNCLLLAGGTMTGPINMGEQDITNADDVFAQGYGFVVPASPQAVSLNGTSSYVSVPTSASLQGLLNPGAQPRTVAVWVYWNGSSHSYTSVFSNEESGDYGGQTFLITSSGKLAVYGVGGTVINGTGTHTIATGTWTHIAFTYDGTTLTTYVNGEQDAQVTSAPVTHSSTNPLLIGNSIYTPRLFNGSMDEMQFYDTALTLAQIQTLYGGGSGYYGAIPALAANLVAGYHFDGDYSDFSANANNGSGEDGPTFVAGLVAAPPVPTPVKLEYSSAAIQLLDNTVVTGGLKLGDYSAVASPTAGQIAYDYTHNNLMVYTGSGWVAVT